MKNLDIVIIDKAKEKLALNWSLIVVFLISFLLCAWLLFSNSMAVYTAYAEWKTNVAVSKKDRKRSFLQDVTDPSYDDEFYPDTEDVMTKSDFKDNAHIKKRIREVKKQHEEYNRALNKAGKSEDQVDERILAGEYDQYDTKFNSQYDTPTPTLKSTPIKSDE